MLFGLLCRRSFLRRLLPTLPHWRSRWWIFLSLFTDHLRSKSWLNSSVFDRVVVFPLNFVVEAVFTNLKIFVHSLDPFSKNNHSCWYLYHKTQLNVLVVKKYSIYLLIRSFFRIEINESLNKLLPNLRNIFDTFPIFFLTEDGHDSKHYLANFNWWVIIPPEFANGLSVDLHNHFCCGF